MSRLRLKISMSLDGFVAGPEQSVVNPIGIGGMGLHEWVFPLKVWRSMHAPEPAPDEDLVARTLGPSVGCSAGAAVGLSQKNDG